MSQLQAVYWLECNVRSVLRLVQEILKRDVIGQASAKKIDYQTHFLLRTTEIAMTKHILLLAAVLGLVAQSSVFAADPSPSPSASPKTTHHHKHHKASTPAASPSATPKAS